jgi:hypothetical protein
MSQKFSAKQWQIILAFSAGILLGITLVIAIDAVFKQLRDESVALNESSEILVELLDEQDASYREPATFAYLANCGRELEYRPPTNQPMPGGRGKIPILCPSHTVTELRINILPTNPSCTIPMIATSDVISGLTLRYRVTCTR